MSRKELNIEGSNRYGPLAEDVLSVFERAIGSSLPEAYRDFLMQHNGGKPKPDYFDITGSGDGDRLHGVYGIHDGPEYLQLAHALETFRSRLPPGIIPIADDPFGNLICLGVSGRHRGKIYFWDHEKSGEDVADFRALTLLTESFDEFLDGLYAWTDPDATELETIIENNDVESLTRLLDEGFDIESTDQFERTAIETAAIKNRPDIIKLLFEKGAELRTALALAKQNAEFFPEHEPTVALLERMTKQRKG